MTLNRTMTANEYLRQYELAVSRIRRYEEAYAKESMLIDAVRSLSDNDGMPHGSGIGRPTEAKAIRLADKKMRLVDAKLNAIRIRQEIFDTVMSLEGLEADVLVERYLNLDDSGHQQTWEVVCDRVHYSWPTVRTAWHRGLNMVEEILNTRTYNNVSVL